MKKLRLVLYAVVMALGLLSILLLPILEDEVLRPVIKPKWEVVLTEEVEQPVSGPPLAYPVWTPEVTVSFPYPPPPTRAPYIMKTFVYPTAAP